MIENPNVQCWKLPRVSQYKDHLIFIGIFYTWKDCLCIEIGPWLPSHPQPAFMESTSCKHLSRSSCTECQIVYIESAPSQWWRPVHWQLVVLIERWQQAGETGEKKTNLHNIDGLVQDSSNSGSFSVPSDNQGCHPDDLFISVHIHLALTSFISHYCLKCQWSNAERYGQNTKPN